MLINFRIWQGSVILTYDKDKPQVSLTAGKTAMFLYLLSLSITPPLSSPRSQMALN
jgi:hypothetical protein